MLDFELLEKVHKKAKTVAVGYTLHYCEADDSFYFTIESSAPTENWIGKNHSFNIAVLTVCEWLDSIGA